MLGLGLVICMLDLGYLNLAVLQAEAVIGRPATPGSVAGVRRRTRRRTCRRWAVGTSLTALPAGCTRVGGVYHCSGEYLRPTYRGSTAVYVVVEGS